MNQISIRVPPTRQNCVRTHLLKQQRTTPTLPLRTQGEDNQEKDIQNAKFRLTSHRRSPRCRCRPPRAAATSVFNKKNPTQSNNGSSHPSQLYRKRKKRRIEGRDGPDRGGGAIHGRTRWTGARPIRPFCKERGILPELRKDSEEQGAGQSRAGGGSSERLRARDCCLLL
jgi:hypothetical protein